MQNSVFLPCIINGKVTVSYSFSDKQGKVECIGGVFKKSPNFLNNAPTGTEGALRLLSAPSGGF